MIQVSKQVFNNFLKDKKTTVIQGDSFHSNYWLDENGGRIAYMASSSWCIDVVYMIEDNLADNFEATNLITNILNK